MFQILHIGHNQYELRTDGKMILRGPQNDIREDMVQFGIEPLQIAWAFQEMRKNSHNVASFGALGSFVSTYALVIKESLH